MTLEEAQEYREFLMMDQRLDKLLKLRLGAENVSARDKHKLRGILRHYAKMKHPFRACVRDNTKRFGKEGAERICATLKDVIRGTTKWRGKNNPRDHGAPGVVGLYSIDDGVLKLLDALTEEDLMEIVGGSHG